MFPVISCLLRTSWYELEGKWEMYEISPGAGDRLEGVDPSKHRLDVNPAYTTSRAMAPTNVYNCFED